MRKIILLLFVLALAGCKPVLRENPTDPEAANYGGWTYIGEIGVFTKLSDFTLFLPGGDGSQDSIIAVDEAKNEVSRYLVSGAPEWKLTSAVFPGISAPTGVCEQAGYCYIMDNTGIDAFQITTGSTTGWSEASITGYKIISHENILYAAKSSPPGVISYISYVTPPQYYTAAVALSVTEGDTTCANCVSAISGLAFHTASNSVLLVDNIKQRISVFNNSSGAYVTSIEVGSAVTNAALYGDNVYVPTTDGIRIYNYNTGALIKTIANYGEGNGKIIRPGPIQLYAGKFIFVGSVTHIKVFETAGL